MLSICEDYCKEYCLSFNVKKSKILSFDGKSVEIVQEWKYLGVTSVSGAKLSFSHKPALTAFYRSSNSILASIRKPNEMVQISLLYTNCVPCMSYAAEVVDFSSRDMQSLNVALNDAIPRIFSYNYWERTRSLRQQLGFPNITENLDEICF